MFYAKAGTSGKKRTYHFSEMSRPVSRNADKKDIDESKSDVAPCSSSNHFAIYDVKGAKPQIRNIFDACERGNHQAIMKFAKDKDFEIDAKVSQMFCHFLLMHIVFWLVLRSSNRICILN